MTRTSPEREERGPSRAVLCREALAPPPHSWLRGLGRCPSSGLQLSCPQGVWSGDMDSEGAPGDILLPTGTDTPWAGMRPPPGPQSLGLCGWEGGLALR